MFSLFLSLLVSVFAVCSRAVDGMNQLPLPIIIIIMIIYSSVVPLRVSTLMS